ncbi:Probable tubulin polyglutamylase TTLL1 [Aduncisulcus paluster]|uniref:Probable tubulin polyglutamylase TTLL1 n=1 Tax=Aduncisulcus paluster TaxID=2918883 RepID=A0ABQ5K3Y5_9EUKA|nr:Probable tubulin polyglutamylase TTLL1 [Aduncisulcus paluster]
MVKIGKVKFKTDADRFCTVSNFEKRGWSRGHGADWNFYWATVGTVKWIFSPEAGKRLSDHQIINHFPNHYELTRKDLMVKNIKRYRRELERDQGPLVYANGDSVLDFIPQTYLLPAEYTSFLDEFKRVTAGERDERKKVPWILKPSGRAQGKGIVIIHKLHQVKKYCTPKSYSSSIGRDSHVVSRYIHRPLLVGGRKFDLRLYVLVTSFRPLRAYIHRQGFCRFCMSKYSSDSLSMSDPFVHLTNVAIQKHGEEYDERNGGKWSLESFLFYIESTRGRESCRKMQDRVENIIFHTLQSVKHVILSDKHCFECYGYDLLIDEDLRPWLIEINASPSLSASTVADRLLKYTLLDDILNIVIPPLYPHSHTERGGWRGGVYQDCSKEDLGGFEVLVDERKER